MKNVFSFFRSVKSPASGKENVRFPDSPDFDNLPDFRTGYDVRLSPNLSKSNQTRLKQFAHVQNDTYKWTKQWTPKVNLDIATRGPALSMHIVNIPSKRAPILCKHTCIR